jgi:hypothetical protein
METVLSRINHVHAYSANDVLHEIHHAKELVQSEPIEVCFNESALLIFISLLGVGVS